ncbi:hypothetical protein EMEDMD4_980041 [Sinorhizobium medicae]|uniref:Uncharacterized protein n=1 Tax=Sinorhizobium medicae TaxID=110321 RepID=A0A508X8N1_9HYPH|nr:hypothetical protein EMEDMD4_980041 [Sinorhizobium medicae]
MFKLYSDCNIKHRRRNTSSPSPIQEALRAIQERSVVAASMLPISGRKAININGFLINHTYLIWAGDGPLSQPHGSSVVTACHCRCRLPRFLKAPGLSRPGA